MASLKALKLRIASIKSTQKITKAMKMVAAAKLRRSQEAAEAARPYSERMAAVMASLGSRIVVGPESPKLLTGTGAASDLPARRRHVGARARRRVQHQHRSPRPQAAPTS